MNSKHLAATISCNEPHVEPGVIGRLVVFISSNSKRKQHINRVTFIFTALLNGMKHFFAGSSFSMKYISTPFLLQLLQTQTV